MNLAAAKARMGRYIIAQVGMRAHARHEGLGKIVIPRESCKDGIKFVM